MTHRDLRRGKGPRPLGARKSPTRVKSLGFKLSGGRDAGEAELVSEEGGTPGPETSGPRPDGFESLLARPKSSFGRDPRRLSRDRATDGRLMLLPERDGKPTCGPFCALPKGEGDHSRPARPHFLPSVSPALRDGFVRHFPPPP